MFIQKKLTTLAFAFGISSAAFGADLNVWNWSDYIAQDTVSNFTKETNIKTNYVLFDSNELVEARLLSGHSGFDAVMMTSYYVPRLAKAGALEKIDHEKIANWNNLDKNRLSILAQLDEGNQYAYPYTEISLGIAYNTKKIKEIFGEDYKVDSWDFLFKKENSDKLKQCGIAVLDSPIEVISATMHYLGKDPTSSNANDYKEAEKILTELASNTAYFHSSRYINDLASGEICAAIGYSGDILQANDRAALAKQDYEIEYIFPQEGSIFWYDCFVIAKNAKNYDNAMTWFNYLMRSDVASNISKEIRYILPVTEAIELLDPKLKANKNVVIPKELLDKSFFMQSPSAKVSQITNRIWNRIKINSEKTAEEETSAWE